MAMFSYSFIKCFHALISHLILSQIFTRTYVAGIKRPFSVRYNPYTCSVEVLDNPLKIQGGLEGVKDEIKVLTDALAVLS